MKALLIALTGLALATPASARMLDPNIPADAFEISKRVQCGEKDGIPAVYYWSGKIYARVQGEPDRHIFNGEGMNVRQCVAVEDPKLSISPNTQKEQLADLIGGKGQRATHGGQPGRKAAG